LIRFDFLIEKKYQIPEKVDEKLKEQAIAFYKTSSY